MSQEQQYFTRNYSRDFQESEKSVIYAWVGKMDAMNLRHQYAALFVSMKPADGGYFSANVRLGPSELRALADELKAAADWLETNNPNKP